VDDVELSLILTVPTLGFLSLEALAEDSMTRARRAATILALSVRWKASISGPLRASG